MAAVLPRLVRTRDGGSHPEHSTPEGDGAEHVYLYEESWNLGEPLPVSDAALSNHDKGEHADPPTQFYRRRC